MPTCYNCKKDFPNHKKINGEWKNLSSRKFCLNCSPFKSHNTRKILSCTDTKTCSSCKITKQAYDFYPRKNGTPSSWCKVCVNEKSKTRQRIFKKNCVEYKSGACCICGYNKCNAALEFHHTNPNEKEFTISKMRNTTFNEKTQQELDKCILICRNCHAELHVDEVI